MVSLKTYYRSLLLGALTLTAGTSNTAYSFCGMGDIFSIEPFNFLSQFAKVDHTVAIVITQIACTAITTTGTPIIQKLLEDTRSKKIQEKQANLALAQKTNEQLMLMLNLAHQTGNEQLKEKVANLLKTGAELSIAQLSQLINNSPQPAPPSATERLQQAQKEKTA